MIPKCNQCDSSIINGVYCHEIGCPNFHKYYSEEMKMWVSDEILEDFDVEWEEEIEEDDFDLVGFVENKIEELEIVRNSYLENRSERHPELFIEEWDNTEEGKELNRLYDLLDELKGDE